MSDEKRVPAEDYGRSAQGHRPLLTKHENTFDLPEEPRFPLCPMFLTRSIEAYYYVVELIGKLIIWRISGKVFTHLHASGLSQAWCHSNLSVVYKLRGPRAVLSFSNPKLMFCPGSRPFESSEKRVCSELFSFSTVYTGQLEKLGSVPTSGYRKRFVWSGSHTTERFTFYSHQWCVLPLQNNLLLMVTRTTTNWTTMMQS